MTEIKLTVRAGFWPGRGMTLEQVRVVDGVVLVLDELTGHYTSVHSLSDRAERRILQLAARRACGESVPSPPSDWLGPDHCPEDDD